MIYLDNAATSFPKPQGVVGEVARCVRLYGGNPGRGSHRLSMRAAEKIYECREALARLLGNPNPENVVFTLNATAAINLAVKGLLRQGDHVLLSDLEHNAVFRPIHRLAANGTVTYDVFPSLALSPNRSPDRICAEIEARILPNTRMLICAHASNICPVTMPLAEIGALCARRGILFVVDAAQSAGRLPIDQTAMKIDALCVPGHKGLFGVQGCGALLLREGLTCSTLVEGGSGMHSLEPFMPEEPPERYEAGTLPTPAIASLCEGVRFLEGVGLDAISEVEDRTADLIRERLLSLRGVTVATPSARGPIVLFHSDASPADRIASELDRRGICVRAGFHCAALAHKTLATPTDGAVRISTSFFSSPRHPDALWHAMREILE